MYKKWATDKSRGTKSRAAVRVFSCSDWFDQNRFPRVAAITLLNLWPETLKPYILKWAYVN